jgi:hypothetical protein
MSEGAWKGQRAKPVQGRDGGLCGVRWQRGSGGEEGIWEGGWEGLGELCWCLLVEKG